VGYELELTLNNGQKGYEGEASSLSDAFGYIDSITVGLQEASE